MWCACHWWSGTGATRSRERNWETGKQAHTHSLSILLPASELYKRDQSDSKYTFKDSLRAGIKGRRKKATKSIELLLKGKRKIKKKNEKQMTQNRSGLQCDTERCVKVAVA